MALYSALHLPIQLINTPAKIPTFNQLILRIPSLILHPRCRIPSLSLIPTLRANPPQKFIYPDPIPEFAQAETQKFKIELKEKLLKDKDEFGDELNRVIDVCAEILHEFLSKEYGGPGTLLVEPFTNMLIALKENNLPGAPIAARASLLWAQNSIDQDWLAWNSSASNN